MCGPNWMEQDTIVEPLQDSPLCLLYTGLRKSSWTKDLCSKQRKVMGFEFFFFIRLRVATFYRCHRRKVSMTVNIKLGQRQREGKNKTM